MTSHHRRWSGVSILAVAALAVAGCSTVISHNVSSSHSAGPGQSGASTVPGTSKAAPPSDSPTVPAESGTPAITPAALRHLVSSYSDINNAANHANSFSQLTKVDGGIEREQDRAYTQAGSVNGYRVPAFYSLAGHVAVPTVSGDKNQYAIVDETVGSKPAVKGALPGQTEDQLAAYIKTPQGWRLGNAVGLAASQQAPVFAKPGPTGVTSQGTTAAVKAATARVRAVATTCATQQTSPLITKPSTCGELSEARQIASFKVTASVGASPLPSYTVLLSNGSTLVIGAVNIGMTVRSSRGIAWQQANIVSGLLGIKAATNPAVRYGYAEQLVMSVAVVIPANGTKATVLSVETGDLSARKLGKPQSSGGGVSV